MGWPYAAREKYYIYTTTKCRTCLNVDKSSQRQIRGFGGTYDDGKEKGLAIDALLSKLIHVCSYIVERMALQGENYPSNSGMNISPHKQEIHAVGNRMTGTRVDSQ